MSILCDYFACGSDEEAVAVLDWPAGPSSPPTPKRTFVRRTPDRVGIYPTVQLPGIEPTVMMATLEALLTRRDADEIMAEPGWEPIAERDGGERMIVPIKPSLVDALTSASEQDLRSIAGPWSETEEFFGDGDPELLGGALIELASLAREARRTGQRLYCWMSR
jgi:hypothetical protein